jgi:ABC-type nitrate/sulfonate/bicarbonate transport system substrate-binding protein
MRSMVEATDYLHDHPDESAKQVAATLKLDPGLTASLMPRVQFEMRLDNDSLAHMQDIEAQIKQMGKLAKPVDWASFFDLEPLRSADPSRVTLVVGK